jgi:hypothetical protein
MSRARWFNLAILALLLSQGLLPVPVQARQKPDIHPAAPEKTALQPGSFLTRSSPGAPQAPQDTPDYFVSAPVVSFLAVDPKLFWYSGVSPCPPAAPTQANAPNDTETISRVAIYGGPQRTLYSAQKNCNQSEVLSNVITDGTYLYWMSASQGGLAKYPVEASPGDPIILVSNAVSGMASLVFDGGDIYVLTYASPGSLWQVNKYTGVSNQVIANAGSYPGGLQNDGYGLYWLVGNTLQQMVTYYGPPAGPIAGSVNSFFAAAQLVYYSSGNQLLVYSNLGDPTTTIYTSVDPNATITSLISDGANLFFIERRPNPCNPQPCFPSYNYVLFRSNMDGSNPVELYVQQNVFASLPARSLQAAGNFLFWLEDNVIRRLPKNAAALPKINLRATGMEVIQSVQRADNSIRLVQGKRTFVRLYVQADGAYVSGVTASLYLVDGQGTPISASLLPVNPVGTKLTVLPSPSRNFLNDSFLFELPWDWTNGPINLRGVVNPYGYPLEPNFGDNQVTLNNISFSPSPRLQVQFVGWGYILNNQYYYPLIATDIVQTYSWLRRSYPLASSPGFSSDPSAGLRPNLWFIADDGLASRVNQTAKECASMSDKTLCASAYVNGLMVTMRKEEGIPDNVFMYGMISDRAGFFPRGQEGGSKVSSGPAGVPNTAPAFFGAGWENDQTYADWYAGHEIGHSLGRAHPNPNSDDPATKATEGCGHSRSDPGYPYPNAQISSNDGAVLGFDAGDQAFGIPMRLMPGVNWFDNMSYCSPKWWSDYTYNALYNAMPLPALKDPASPERLPLVPGSYLSISGVIISGTNSAAIQHLRRLDNASGTTTPIPGGYTLHLIGAGSTILASYDFSALPVDDSGGKLLSFAEVVNDAPNTTRVEIIRQSDSLVLASQDISPNPPVVSNVQITGAPDPVTGTVTLTWDASDADNDPLSFDILYSRDNGATFQPLQKGTPGSSIQVDTARLGGSSTAIFRVLANDGANTGYADSAPFTMQSKPPIPHILLPGNNLHIHYGQLVNFSGEAEDFEDGSIPPANLSWSTQKGPLGSGSQLSSDSLPPGVNLVTLTATDSDFNTASTSITIVVDDDLSLPGPNLDASPTTVAWSVSPGSTSLQAAEVGIRNTGSGSLAFTASTPAPWLSLNAFSGTAPFTLTLTAEPSGIPPFTSADTKVTIISPAASDHTTQTVTITVSLATGSLMAPPPPLIKFYAPLLFK